MKYSLVLVSLLCMVSFAAQSKMPEVTKIPEKKVETVTVPSETTVNVMCQEIQRGQKKYKEESSKKNKMNQGGKANIAKANILKANKPLLISVVGQGVAPVNTTSPAQAYALAKRAATADAYRLIAEKVKGVNVDGQDLVKNMMVKRSTVRTSVQAMVRNANIVETTFKDGLCEVEMEITLLRSDFAR